MKFCEGTYRQTMWTKICSYRKLLREQRCLFRADAAEGVLFEAAGQVYAFENACPHQGLPLADGMLDPERGTLTCIYHHWCFQLNDGSGQGTRVRTWPAKVEDGYVWVDT